MRRANIPSFLAALAVAGVLSTGPAGAAPRAATAGPQAANDRAARGQSFKDLRPAAVDGPCKGNGFEVGTGTDVSCTPGPDPAPDGVDVTQLRTTAALTTASEALASTGGSIECDGDGSAGNRIQAVYAVSSDRPDRFSSLQASLVNYAKTTDAVFSNSAAKTGGIRHLRWVTTPTADGTCPLSILKVVMSPSGDDSFGNTKSELLAKGLNRTDRKYMVWTDANVYCGIANVYTDDRATQDNLNNGGNTSVIFARVDAGCWGSTAAAEAHEITHLLGGVQPTAPNGTAGWHCTDESDLLCYSDGSGEPLSYRCPSGDEALLDCNNDDYFNTNPPAGSYLANFWNVANSSFLLKASSGATAPPPPAPAPDTTAPAAPTNVSALAGNARVSLSWTGVVDAAQYRIYRNGVASLTTTSTSTTVTGLTNGTTYTFAVTALDAAGNESAKSAAVSATPRRKLRG